MSKLLQSVDMRTQLAGKNRMELLIFYLNGPQPYGINVFKVKEVYQNPNLTLLPKMNHSLVGVTYFRGNTIPVIDLSKALGLEPHPKDGDYTVITSEFNRKMQALLVRDVHRIINIRWEDIHAPPPISGGQDGSYVIAITEVDGRLVEVIDVEKVIDEISPDPIDLTVGIPQKTAQKEVEVLIADDSVVARKKITNVLTELNCKVTQMKTGMETWEHLQGLLNEGIDPCEKYLMLISDIEMPEMDGYTLTTQIKSDPRIKNMYITLHSSMSGDFNETMIERVGADQFLAKFNSDAFAEMVMMVMKEKGFQ